MQLFVCLYPYMFASVKIKSRNIFCKKFGSRTKTLPNLIGFRLHAFSYLSNSCYVSIDAFYFVCHVEVKKTNPSLRPLTACVLFQFDSWARTNIVKSFELLAGKRTGSYHKFKTVVTLQQRFETTTHTCGGEITVSDTWPCAMPSHDSAFWAGVMITARYPDHGHRTDE